MTIQTKNIKADIAAFNFESLHSERCWREMRLKYPKGSQFVRESQMIITDILEIINAKVAGTNIGVGLWYGTPKNKKALGVRIESGRGSSEVVFIEVKASLISFGGRPHFIGSGASVVALALSIVDEVRRVSTGDSKYAVGRGT